MYRLEDGSHETDRAIEAERIVAQEYRSKKAPSGERRKEPLEPQRTGDQ